MTAPLSDDFPVLLGPVRVETRFTLEAQAAGVNGAYLTALRSADRAGA